MKNQIIKSIEENKIIAICRGIYGQDLVNLVTSINEGGVNLVEVTFDQNDPKCIEKTGEAIKLLSETFEGKVDVGAGTVITREQVLAAKNAGAKYIISPNVNLDIIKYTNELGMVSMPGAMTPSEIIAADQAGADFVKIFPAGTLGLKYIKDISGPINHVRFVAAAGVTPENLQDFLDLGFAGAGISNYLTNKKMVQEGKLDILKEHAQELVNIVKK